MSKKRHHKPIPPIRSNECGPYVSIPIEFVGKIVSVEPICAGSYSLTVGRDTHISLLGVAPDWMTPGAYIRILLDSDTGDKIKLLSDKEAEVFRKAEAKYANENPFTAEHGTT